MTVAIGFRGRLKASAFESWRENAACKGCDTQLFYQEKPWQLTEAMSICSKCPVKKECLDWAKRAGERWGVWGGKDQTRRKRATRKSA